MYLKHLMHVLNVQCNNMSIIRTKGQGNLVVTKNRFSGKAIITSTPIGVNNFKDLYSMDKKLTIENFDKDLNVGVFYGWDVISADETEDSYLFQLRNRTDNKLRVYITLGRELQYSDLPYYPEMMYQCYIHDDNNEWSNRSWFRAHDITYKNFWGIVEETVTNHHLPF